MWLKDEFVCALAQSSPEADPISGEASSGELSGLANLCSLRSTVNKLTDLHITANEFSSAIFYAIFLQEIFEALL